MSAAPAPMAKARNDFIDIQSSGTVRRVPPDRADALLAYLRNLRTPAAQATGLALKQTATLAADAVVTPITIRTAQGELWEIWPTQVRLKSGLTPDPKTDAAALTTRVFTISPLQYEHLRGLAAAIQ